MTNFRPKSLSPEALEAWDEAEANIQASMQRIRELAAPLRHSDTAPLLWVLYNHQGAHSPIGQPIRRYLGMGQFERMTSEQIQAAKQVNSSASHIMVPPQNCRQRLKSEGKPYPKSSCEVCGSILSPNRMWQECDAALAMEVSQQLETTPVSLMEAYRDAIAGLRYIEQTAGRLYGVGWDRVFDTADSLLSDTDCTIPPLAGSLVERVLQKVLDTPSPAPLSISPNQIRAAILEVAAWLKVESEDHFGNGLHWSKRLEQEANQ